MVGPSPENFPGTLYDGDGGHLAGAGFELTQAALEALPFKATVVGTVDPDALDMAPSDRLWLLPDGLGTPPRLPGGVVDELVGVIRSGGKVFLVARGETVGAMVRDTLLLTKEEGGTA